MPITFTKLGQYGRLGNQLFQIAAVLSYAKRDNVDYILPEWAYAQYFKEGPRLKMMKDPKADTIVPEPFFHFTDMIIDVGRMVDMQGYFQSEKNFFDPDLIRAHFTFHPDLVERLRTKLNRQEGIEYVAVHVRRGDYVNNPNYYQVPMSYYKNAMRQFDAEKTHFMIFSDDITWCIKHFDGPETMTFVTGQKDIEDLCMMTQCDHFIISNSSFSWWGAWLGEIPGVTKVYVPGHWLSEELAKKRDTKDLVPDRWIKNIPKKKIDLRDVTFTIPIRFDHEHRKQNLEMYRNFKRPFSSKGKVLLTL